MKFCGTYWGFDKEEMLKEIPKIAKHFNYIRLSYWIKDLKSALPQLLEFKKKLGISYHIHMSWIDMRLGTNMEKIRLGSVEEAKDAIDFFEKLGGGVLTFHPSLKPVFIKNEDCEDRELIFNNEVKSFKEIVKYAKDKKVIIAVENLPLSNKFSSAFKDTSNFEYHKKLLEKIPDENFGITFDTGHQNCSITPMKLEKIFSEIGNRIKYFHLHDNDGDKDKHKVIGEGTFDWLKFMKLIKNFKGFVEFEMMDLQDQVKSKKYLSNLNS